MLTFKQFLEAFEAPQLQHTSSSTSSRDHMKGALTDNQLRVLAILSTNQMKTSPGRARQVIAGDQNLVQAVKVLKQQFGAVDVKPDAVTINQQGISLATTYGIIDANTGELNDHGQSLASTSSTGVVNKKTVDATMSSMDQTPPPMGV